MYILLSANEEVVRGHQNWNKDTSARAKVRVLVEKEVKHIEKFRTISNEMLISLFIMCWWYFTCLQCFAQFEKSDVFRVC